MTTFEQTDITQEPEDYRGGLIYRQEHGYKMVTMTVSVAPNEQSHVTTHAHGLPVSEEVEHLPGVDLYHFPVTDGERIQLTIQTPAKSQNAWYTVTYDGIVAECSPLSMDIVRSSESLPLVSIPAQEALNEALTHYADQIPSWLEEGSKSDSVHDLADFER